MSGLVLTKTRNSKETPITTNVNGSVVFTTPTNASTPTVPDKSEVYETKNVGKKHYKREGPTVPFSGRGWGVGDVRGHTTRSYPTWVGTTQDPTRQQHKRSGKKKEERPEERSLRSLYPLYKVTGVTHELLHLYKDLSS